MSYSIPQHHVQQYRGNIRILAQQKKSRLYRTTQHDGDVVGKRVYYDRIGATSAQRITTRHGDTPLNQVPHSRRAADMLDYDTADLVDKVDRLKTLYSPDNYYAKVQSAALGRSIDDVIISALGGSALEGEDGSTSVALPSSQKVAVNDHTYDSLTGNVGLTTSKLLVARDIMLGAEVDEYEKFYVVCSQKQLSNLLSDDKVPSNDYNTVKALVRGEINTWLGFEFVRSERLPTDSNGYRLIYAYTGSAVGCDMAQDITVDIGPRRDKRNATQIYSCMSLGAVRIEDSHVVEIACLES